MKTFPIGKFPSSNHFPLHFSPVCTMQQVPLKDEFVTEISNFSIMLSFFPNHMATPVALCQVHGNTPERMGKLCSHGDYYGNKHHG